MEKSGVPGLCRGVGARKMVSCQQKGDGAMDQKKIGAFLKALRTEKGLTQEQLAGEMLVSSRTISRWETGVSLR